MRILLTQNERLKNFSGAKIYTGPGKGILHFVWVCVNFKHPQKKGSEFHEFRYLHRLRRRDICLRLSLCKFYSLKKERLKFLAFRNLHRPRQRDISFCLSLCKFYWLRKKDNKNPGVQKFTHTQTKGYFFCLSLCKFYWIEKERLKFQEFRNLHRLAEGISPLSESV